MIDNFGCRKEERVIPHLCLFFRKFRFVVVFIKGDFVIYLQAKGYDSGSSLGFEVVGVEGCWVAGVCAICNVYILLKSFVLSMNLASGELVVWVRFGSKRSLSEAELLSRLS